MKEIPQPIDKSFPPLKLYIDDIATLYDLLKKNCAKVTLLTTKYELQDVSLFKECGPKDIHELRFRCHDPYISLDFLPSRARLHIDDSSIVNKGLAYEITAILQKRIRKCLRPFSSVVFVSIIGFIAFLLPIMIIVRAPYDIGASILGLCLFLAYILFGALSMVFSLKRYSTIVFSESNRQSSFLSKNRDQLIIVVITVVLTALATSLVNWLINSLAQK